MDMRDGLCPCGERHCINCHHQERHHDNQEGVCGCCDHNEFEAELPPMLFCS